MKSKTVLKVALRTSRVFFKARMTLSQFFQITMAATMATPIPIITSAIGPMERFSPINASFAADTAGVSIPMMPPNPAIIGPAAMKIGASMDAFSINAPFSKVKSESDDLSLSMTVLVEA